MGAQLGDDLSEAGAIVCPDLGPDGFGGLRTGRVEAVQPAGNLLPDAEKLLELKKTTVAKP